MSAAGSEREGMADQAPGASSGDSRPRLNKAQIAQAWRTSVNTVDRWIAEGCPVAQRGGNGKPWEFDGEAVKAWHRERSDLRAEQRAAEAAEIERLQGELDLHGGSADGVDALPLKARGLYYEVEAKRTALARQRGELVEAWEVRAEQDALFAYLADQLQAIPDRLERTLQLKPEAVEKLIAEVDAIQEELSRRLATDEELSSELDSAAAA